MNKTILIYIILTVVLIYNWFSSGKLFAYAEEGIPLYNSNRTLQIVRSVWVDSGFGYDSVFYLPRIPFYAFCSFLQMIGFAAWQIQAIIFFFLLLMPIIFVPKVAKLFFPHISEFSAACMGLFYLFNIYTQTQVWNRFLYPLIFLWSFLPIFLYFFTMFIQTGKYKYLSFLLIGTLVYCDVFGLTSSIFTLWAPAGVISVLHAYNTKSIKSILRFFMACMSWGLVHIWWLYPLWRLQDGSYSVHLNPKDAIESLRGVSVYYPFEEMVLLRQKYFFSPTSPWYLFYQQRGVMLLNYSVLLFAVFGLLVSFWRKNWNTIFILLCVALLISGGYNGIGKYVFDFLYSHFPVTQTLRNPYEKFGTVLVFAYAIYIGLAIDFIKRWIPLGKLISLVFFVSVCGYLVLPMWNGTVFPNIYSVTVPAYYEEANTYIKSIQSKRIFQLPFLNGSVLEYTWGYRGEEPSEYLFDTRSYSKQYSMPFYDRFYSALEPYVREKNFPKLLTLIGVDTVVLHDDVIRSTYHSYEYADTKRYINSWKNSGESKTIGKLDIVSIYNEGSSSSSADIRLYENITPVQNTKEMFDTVVTDGFNTDIRALGYETMLPKTIGNYSLPASYTSIIISPTHYRCDIKNSTNPFILELTQGYNPHWTVQVNSKQLPVPHFPINGVFNGWVISDIGSYTIDIIFSVWPWD